MATSYVLLESAEEQHQVRVVAHSDIPNSNNAVNVKWRDAVVGWVGSQSDPVGDMTSVIPLSILPVGVQAQLDTGALYEWEGIVRFNANLSDGDKWSLIETWVFEQAAVEFTAMQTRLDYYGKIGSVA